VSIRTPHVGRSRSIPSVAVITVSVAVLALGVLIVRHDSRTSGVNDDDSGRGAPARIFGNQGNEVLPDGTGGLSGFGSSWSPELNTSEAALETTLVAAERKGAPFIDFRPQLDIAGDSNLATVWLGSEPAGTPPILPDHPQVILGLLYRSGVVITVTPWVYGENAPPISFKGQAENYATGDSSGPARRSGSHAIDGHCRRRACSPDLSR
jgi:hypothetical protein